MGTDIPLRFRPTVVVCVGEQGREVGAQLATLLPTLGDARQVGVALLTVDEAAVDDATAEDEGAAGAGRDGARRVDPLLGSWYAPDLDAVIARSGAPTFDDRGATPLSLLMVEALRGQNPDEMPSGEAPRRGVLDDTIVWRIRDDGYGVPKAMAAVWIAAAADSPSLARVAQEVRAALASEDVDGWVLLALANVYPRDPALHRAQAARCAEQPWPALLLGDERAAPLATYAYVFESHGERGTFWEGPDDVAYAAAEAIFVLTAGGITTTREFEETLRQSLPQMVKHPYERISGVGTSRLTFPRAHVEQFCANKLGADILREWAGTRDIAISKAEEARQRGAAKEVLTEMRRRTADVPTLRRGGRSSPRLSAEGVARARGLAQQPAAPDDGMIFRHLSPAEMERLDDGRQPLPERLVLQRAKAEEGFPLWKKSIRQGWEAYGHDVERRVLATANERFLEGVEGIARAGAFADELKSQCGLERVRLTRMREDREVAYTRFLSRMEKQARGSWAYTPAAPRVTPAPAVLPAPPFAAPPFATAPFAAPLPLPAAPPAIEFAPVTPESITRPLTPSEIPSEILSEVPSPPPSLTPSLASMQRIQQVQMVLPEVAPVEVEAAPVPGPEDVIFDALAQRYAWHRERLPRAAALVGVELATVPPGVLLLQALLPTAWLKGAWSGLLVTLAAIAFVALTGWMYAFWRQRRIEHAAYDMHRLYRRMFAYRCERHEDERREALLVGVLARVRRMRERLGDWEAFATGIADEMEREARAVEHQLFDGAIGRRDVVVANKQRLRHDTYNLHHLADDVGARRQRQPMEGYEWHGNTSDMLAPLRRHLNTGMSLMDAPPADIAAPIREFCHTVVRPYLTGNITDLGAALESMPAVQTTDLFNHLVERSTILYRPIDPPRAPFAFVAAREDHHPTIQDRDQAVDMVTLPIQDREWLGVVRLLPGGSMPTFHQSVTAAQPDMAAQSVATPLDAASRPLNAQSEWMAARAPTPARWAERAPVTARRGDRPAPYAAGGAAPTSAPVSGTPNSGAPASGLGGRSSWAGRPAADAGYAGRAASVPAGSGPADAALDDATDAPWAGRSPSNSGWLNS